MSGRASGVAGILTGARGEWVTGAAISERLGIGRPQAAAAISEARDLLGLNIETHPVRGGGWRIPVAGSTAVRDAPPPLRPRTRQLDPRSVLSAMATTLLEALRHADGDFTTGQMLGGLIGCDMAKLHNTVYELRRKRPDLKVEAARGHGYRLATGKPAPIGLPPARPQKHVTHRAAIDLLATLHPAIAERVRDAALEAGETADDAIARLLFYGVEVHRDLIASGTHPLQLRRAA